MNKCLGCEIYTKDKLCPDCIEEGCRVFKDRVKWYKEGKLHRDSDLPAVIHAGGYKAWYLNGKRHRLDGPAVIHTDGTQKWYKEGKLHREDGPAVIYDDGSQEFWVEDKLHRLYGPAVIGADGTQKWYINGKEYTEAEYIML